MTARFDAPIIEYAAAHRVAGLTSVMKALTTAGNPLYLSITVLIGGAILAWLDPKLETASRSRSRHVWRRIARPSNQAGGSPNSTSFAVLGGLGNRFVFPFRSRYGVCGGLPDSRMYVCRDSGEIGCQDRDLCDRNRGAAPDWYVAGVFRSALADGCHQRLGARLRVVGDGPRLEHYRLIAPPQVREKNHR